MVRLGLTLTYQVRKLPRSLLMENTGTCHVEDVDTRWQMIIQTWGWYWFRNQDTCHHVWWNVGSQHQDLSDARSILWESAWNALNARSLEQYINQCNKHNKTKEYHCFRKTNQVDPPFFTWEHSHQTIFWVQFVSQLVKKQPQYIKWLRIWM